MLAAFSPFSAKIGPAASSSLDLVCSCSAMTRLSDDRFKRLFYHIVSNDRLKSSEKRKRRLAVASRLCLVGQVFNLSLEREDRLKTCPTPWRGPRSPCGTHGS